MGGRTLIQSEIDEGWYGYDLARATGDESLHVVPPIPFDVVEREAHRRGVPRSYGRFWSRRFAADLWQAPARSPLHEGRWHLGPAPPRFSCSVLDPATVHSVVTQAASGEVDWGRPVYPITLRNMSAPDDGRVKAWRKLARRGQLPPVLLWWVSGLQAYVVLDGHDRLNAASCEGVGVDTIGLHRVELASAPQHEREETMEALSAWEATRQQGANRSETDAINRLILRLYQERLHERPTKATYLDDVVLGIEPDAGD